jgi:hypothetical protein
MTQASESSRGARQLELRCRCGRVSGVAHHVTPSSGLRLICYCRSYQAFARLLDRPDVLDAAGGTDIFQMPPGRVEIVTGGDVVRCLQLSSKVFRWYADCCRTPIGNTAGPRIPLVGLIHSFISRDTAGLDELFGAPRYGVYPESATGPMPPNAPPSPSRTVIGMRIARLLLGWWLRGLGRPNPFFDAQTGAPRSVPRRLTPEERAAVLPAVVSSASPG